MRISPPERFDRVIDGRAICGLTVLFREDRSGEERRIWMAVDQQYADLLSLRDDVFLPTLANYAMLLCEDLDLGGIEVDSYFLRNVRLAMRQYTSWYPKLRQPEMGNYRAGKVPEKGPKTAAFCSGGVDGFFTVLRHTPQNADDLTRNCESTLDHAYHVLYSADPEGIAAHGPAASALSGALRTREIPVVRVYSNMYVFAPLQARNYGMVGHGAGFASLAHALSRSTGKTLLGSSHTYGDLHPYGSTPEIDPLYSSGSMNFVNDGSLFTRMEKVEFLCSDRTALNALNVCDNRAPGADYSNCSVCHKCLRTMIAIDVCGSAGIGTPAFDWSQYSPQAFGRAQLRGSGMGDEHVFAAEIRDAARGKRPDIFEATQRAISRSRFFGPLFLLEDIAKKMPLGLQTRKSLKGLKKQFLSLLGASR